MYEGPWKLDLIGSLKYGNASVTLPLNLTARIPTLERNVLVHINTSQYARAVQHDLEATSPRPFPISRSNADLW